MSNGLVRISILALVLAAVTPAVCQTSISDETRAVPGQLTTAQAAEVDAFVELITQRMTAEPADPNVVKSARRALISTYRGETGAGFRRYFAQKLADTFVGQAMDPQRSPMVLVNAAMAAGAVTHPAMAPAFERMLRHPNPAVRYFGAKGFDGAAQGITALGADEAGRMLNALGAAAQNESSPMVVRALAQALDLSGVTGVDAATLGNARTRARQVLIGLMGRHLQDVRDGDVGMADAFGYAVRGVEAMTAQAPSAERTAALQAVANVMANAAQAYADHAIQVDEDGRERVVDPPGHVTMLLVYCERAIGEMIGQTESSVTRAIPAGSPQKSDVLRLQLRVNSLVGTDDSPGTLQEHGVTPPEVLPPTAAPSAPGA